MIIFLGQIGVTLDQGGARVLGVLEASEHHCYVDDWPEIILKPAGWGDASPAAIDTACQILERCRLDTSLADAFLAQFLLPLHGDRPWAFSDSIVHAWAAAHARRRITKQLIEGSHNEA